MSDVQKAFVSLNVTPTTRKRARYISAALGRPLNVITEDALRLLQDKHQLPDPPFVKAEPISDRHPRSPE